MLEILKPLLKRELLKLRQEIDSYKSEDVLWSIDKSILNSGGNLCLHLVGNLNTFIGKHLGDTGYVRDRDREFSDKGIPKQELVKRIDETIHVVESTLSKLNDQQLEEEYPVNVFNEKMTTKYFLIHLLSHLTYHLGQINYHRRLLDIS